MNSEEAMARLTEEMGALRRMKGGPTSREIAEMSHVSHTTVAEIMAGRRVAAWSKYAAIIQALGGDPRLLLPLWERIKGVPISGRARPPIGVYITVTEEDDGTSQYLGCSFQLEEAQHFAETDRGKRSRIGTDWIVKELRPGTDEVPNRWRLIGWDRENGFVWRDE